MDYIEAEKFLDQPEEIQKVLRDWWKPERGDLFFIDGLSEHTHSHSVIETNSDNTVGYCNYVEGSLEISYAKIKNIKPLFTEGQLRKFIEDKIHCSIVPCYSPKDVYLINNIETRKGDLMQAYWEAACRIAGGTI